MKHIRPLTSKKPTRKTKSRLPILRCHRSSTQKFVSLYKSYKDTTPVNEVTNNHYTNDYVYKNNVFVRSLEISWCELVVRFDF